METVFNSIPAWLLAGLLLYVAVLVSYAVYDNRKVDLWPPSIHSKQIETAAPSLTPTPSRFPSPVPREYEWQWAGENWYGRVILSPEGEQGTVKMARVFELTKQYKDPRNAIFVLREPPVLDLVNGTFSITDSGQLKISLLARKMTHGYPDYVSHEIKGELKPVACFAGEVEYINTITKEHPKGDMILVNYESLPPEVTGDKFDLDRTYQTNTVSVD